MSDYLYKDLQRKSIQYSEQGVRRSIVVIRISKNKRLLDKHKEFLLRSCSTIIVRNVNNFFNLIQNVESGQKIHTQDDIVMECYIILNNCVEKFDLELESKFYFYLNKSLAQGLHKIIEKNYDKKFGRDVYLDINVVCNYKQESFSVNDSNPLLLDKNFTKSEVLLMQSKIQEEQPESFCGKLGITRNEYYNLLKSIKNKLEMNYFVKK